MRSAEAPRHGARPAFAGWAPRRHYGHKPCAHVSKCVPSTRQARGRGPRAVSLDHLVGAGETRAGADVGEAEAFEELADRALVVGDAVALEDSTSMAPMAFWTTGPKVPSRASRRSSEPSSPSSSRPVRTGLCTAWCAGGGSICGSSSSSATASPLGPHVCNQRPHPRAERDVLDPVQHRRKIPLQLAPPLRDHNAPFQQDGPHLRGRLQIGMPEGSNGSRRNDRVLAGMGPI